MGMKRKETMKENPINTRTECVERTTPQSQFDTRQPPAILLRMALRADEGPDFLRRQLHRGFLKPSPLIKELLLNRYGVVNSPVRNAPENFWIARKWRRPQHGLPYVP
jgi:hypothetical protein